MGYTSILIFSRFSVTLLLISLSPLCVNSDCPDKFLCSDEGRRAASNHENLVVVPQGPYNRRLQELDLSFNRIGILKPYVFADRQIYTLVNLTLSNNTLSDIQVPFRGLSSLSYLDLSNNDLEKFDPQIFIDIPHLKTLVLHHNPYLQLAETGYDLPELTGLILNNCMIKKVPSEFFNKLKALEFINLSENLLENFDSKVLISYLDNLKHIDLRSNRLHVLGEVVSDLPTTIIGLKISSNPWSCNCEIKEAFALYETASNETVPLECSSPEDFKNKTLTAELVKLITCTTTTEATTTASTTVAVEASAMVQSLMMQNDQHRASFVENISNSSDSQEKSGRILVSRDQRSQSSETMNTDKIGDDIKIDSAGWFGNWMVYSAIALVVATSIVVFIVKKIVTKHMSRPGNDLARNSADFGMKTDGYSSISLTDNFSRAV